VQRHLAAPAHEEGLGCFGRERLDRGGESESRVEIGVHLDVAVEVGDRPVGTVLALELERAGLGEKERGQRGTGGSARGMRPRRTQWRCSARRPACPSMDPSHPCRREDSSRRGRCAARFCRGGNPQDRRASRSEAAGRSSKMQATRHGRRCSDRRPTTALHKCFRVSACGGKMGRQDGEEGTDLQTR